MAYVICVVHKSVNQSYVFGQAVKAEHYSKHCTLVPMDYAIQNSICMFSKVSISVRNTM